MGNKNSSQDHSKSNVPAILDRAIASFQRQTLANASRAWEGIMGTARAIQGKIGKDVPKQDEERLLEQMQCCFDPRGGEFAARINTIQLGHTYLSLSEKGKQRFLTLLATHFDIDQTILEEAIEMLKQAQKPEEQINAQQALRKALESGRLTILRHFSEVPEGIKFLVDMRADLLPIRKKSPALTGFEADFKHLLASWFDVGLLNLQRITWNSPASLLEKLIAYEAVHEIKSWSDLKNRLDSDRRCFAFFHHKMPDEPLIFVEVALVNGVATSIQELLDESQPSIDPKEADTAVFYSISNAQEGLAGISFGNFLIKRVVNTLAAEFPNIKQFATLSPIPGFRKWLDSKLSDDNPKLLSMAEQKSLLTLVQQDNPSSILLTILKTSWHKDSETAAILRPILMRLCAHYLIKEGKKTRALDPVAHFHLSNGAVMEQLNWLADISTKGLKQSAGMMVNYLYQLNKIEENHENYILGNTIPASKPMKKLVIE